MKDANRKVLECIICFERYSRDEILMGQYCIETMVCSACYASMQKADYARSCFGKPMLILSNKSICYGYNPAARECKNLCPDRTVCQRIILGGPAPV